LTRLALWSNSTNTFPLSTTRSSNGPWCSCVGVRRLHAVEKRSITENLGEIWGANKDSVSEVLSTELNEKEKEKLDELSGFDFENL